MDLQSCPPPKQLVLEVASVCNLRCPQCWIGLRWIDRHGAPSLLPMDLFHRVCDEAQGYVRHVYLHLWGEPLIHPKIGEMIRRVKEFATIDLATHGLLVTEENAKDIALCDTISVSIDGTTQETYERYRVGGQLQRAMDGLTMLAETAPGKVGWTFVAFKHNEHEIQAAKELAYILGVKFGDKPPLFWDRSRMDEDMPTDEKHRRYRLVNGEWQLKADRLKCREFWETIYILPSGDVITCCYDGNAEWVMGNVNKTSLIDVWNGPEYQKARSTHLSGKLNSICEKYCNLPS